MARGQLRIYLGAAAGVGKTYAMLNEGRRRARLRHGRRRRLRRDRTAGRRRPSRSATSRSSRAGDRVPRQRRSRRWTSTPCSPGSPQVALVDELAHTNVPGSRNEKRWQDVEELLDAGIDVITTRQHPAPRVAERRRRGDHRRQAAGDDPRRGRARGADQIELVDLTPEALRDRLAHGDVYPPERIDAALANYFRPGNLAALRELALAWLADRVDEGLEEYRRSHGIEKPWETRERVLVALTGSPDGERLIRRAARMAQRMNGELVAVHVVPQDGLAAPTAELLERQRELVGELGASYHEVVGEDIGDALLDAARSLNVTQIVMGASRRSRWQRLTERLGDRQGDPRVRHADRRPRRQPPGRGRGGLRAPADAPARLAAAAAHRARLRARRPRTARTRLRALQPARADRAAERPPPLSAARRVDGGARRPLAGAPRRRRRHPARQLVLHSPAAHVHDRARREHPGAGRVPRRRDDGQPLRRSRGEALRPRPKGAGRGRGARPSRRLGSGRGRARQPAARARRPRAPRFCTAPTTGWRIDATSGSRIPATPEAGTTAIELDDDHMLVLAGRPIRAEDQRVLRGLRRASSPRRSSSAS